MERSVLGSAVKTYGGKNRYSRSSSYSYRPSGLIGSNQNIFDDDDPITPFDRLLHEDKTKNTFVQATPLKSTYNGTINTIKTKKFQLHADSRSNALKSVQNVRIDSVSILKSSTVYKFYGSSKSYENKENTVKCKNQLFFSDSDSSGSDVFDYSKTVGKKAATTAKKKKKKDFGLKNASRAINQSDKRKRRLEYRERCKNQSSKNSSSSKCSFVNLNADGYGIPIRRRTLVVDRKSLLSFAKPLDEETGETENITDSFKSMFEGIRKYAEKLENSDQSASIAKNSASNPVDTNSATIENSDQSASVAKNSASNPVNTNSATNPGVSLSPTPIRDSFIIDFRPVQISTPRQSAKYELKIQARSPIHSNSLGDRQSNELDPTNLSKSLQSIKNRLSDRCKEIALCEVFEKSCSLSTKLSETVAVEKVEQSSETPCKIVNSNGSSDVQVEKVNVSGETNCSEVSMDAKNSSESDIEIFSANNSLEETEKNDETESHYMSVESSSIADHSNDVTVEMKSPELFNSDANSTREISRELFRPRAGDSHTSSYLSDSADEKYATVTQWAKMAI